MQSKKILLCADSRILFPQKPYTKIEDFTGVGRPGVETGLDWSSKLHQLTNGIHDFTTHRSGIEHYMVTLFDLNKILQKYPDKYFDLTLLQLGWLEDICYWKPEEIKEILGEHFNESCLTNPGLNNENDRVEYLYNDPQGIKKVFDLINQKSKHCLGIGFHSVKNWCGLFNKRIKETIETHYDALKMNDRYSAQCDYLHFPMDPWWTENYIGADRLHYGRFDHNATDYIAPFVARYINRMDKTINSVLKEYDTEFYKKAIQVGNNIAAITHERDVVLLSLTDTEMLPLMFVGCILYNRIPIVIQHPSHKISPENFDKKINHIIQKTGATLCITDTQYVPHYEHLLTTISELSQTTQNFDIDYPDINRVAFLQLSSGTTDLPKIIEVTHKQIVSHCDEYASFIGLTSEDVVCSWLPLYHDMGLVACFLLPLLTNTKFIHINTFDWLNNPKKLLETITNNQATHVWMPNFAFNYMATKFTGQDLSDINLSSIKQLISCAELTFGTDLENFYKTFAKTGLKPETFRVCYALAENIFAVSQSTGIFSTVHKNQQYISCGQTLPGTSVIIMKDGEDITTEGDNKFIKTLPGEIIRQNDIKIGNVMIKSCYEPSTNERSDFFGYYDTGDLGFMENGHLYITGRQKDSFNSYGINIYPELIEHEVNKHSDILDGRVACFGVLNNGTNDVHICAETHDPNNLNVAKEITQQLQDLYNIVCGVHLKSQYYIIKTSSGKISRSATREKFLNEPTAKARGAT